MAKTATLAGGCFWCIEAAFKTIEGVEDATSGYCGGDVEDPSYRAVCSGTTGHAEAVRVTYDPEVVGYDDLLAVFFGIHDPTQLNRQGPDVGTQYRSAVFYESEAQRETVEAFVAKLEEEAAYDDDIVTEIAPLERFWPAEEKHQDYYEKHPERGYCRAHVAPKVDTVHQRFAELASDG